MKFANVKELKNKTSKILKALGQAREEYTKVGGMSLEEYVETRKARRRKGYSLTRCWPV